MKLTELKIRRFMMPNIESRKKLIKQILQDQKLRELVEERIEILSRSDAPDSHVVKVVLNAFEKLLEDCKK